MKTNVFNLRRLGLLFQRYFTERFNTEAIYWGIMVIAFMFIRNTLFAMTGLILIAGAFYAARFFREIHSRSNGVAYLMIPATHLEKLTAGIVITFVYYFVMMIIAYVTGNLIGTFLNNIMAGIDFIKPIGLFTYSTVQWSLFENIGYGYVHPLIKLFGIKSMCYMGSIFKVFLVTQSIFLLGSIYFKNNQMLKTLLTVVIIHLLLIFLMYANVRLIIFDNIRNMPLPLRQEFGISMENVFEKAIQSFYVFLIPFFWVVSYFRLTEKQI